MPWSWSRRQGLKAFRVSAEFTSAEAQVENDEQREALVLLKEAQDRYQARASPAWWEVVVVLPVVAGWHEALKDVRGEVEALRVRAKAESSMCKRNEAWDLIKAHVRPVQARGTENPKHCTNTGNDHPHPSSISRSKKPMIALIWSTIMSRVRRNKTANQMWSD